MAHTPPDDQTPSPSQHSGTDVRDRALARRMIWVSSALKPPVFFAARASDGCRGGILVLSTLTTTTPDSSPDGIKYHGFCNPRFDICGPWQSHRTRETVGMSAARTKTASRARQSHAHMGYAYMITNYLGISRGRVGCAHHFRALALPNRQVRRSVSTSPVFCLGVE